jgi:hypothetical protein
MVVAMVKPLHCQCRDTVAIISDGVKRERDRELADKRVE